MISYAQSYIQPLPDPYRCTSHHQIPPAVYLKLDLGRPGVLGLGEIVKHLLRVDIPEQLFLLLEESQPVRGDLSRRDQLGKLPCSSA